MKKTISVILSLLVVISMLAACGGQPVAEETANTEATPTSTAAESDTGSTESNVETTLIQMGHCNPGTDIDHYTFYCRKLGEHLLELSGGKYGIEVMSDAQLGAERDLFEGLTMGTVDAALVTNMIVCASIPGFTIFELPFAFETVVDGYKLCTNEEFTEPLRQELYDNWNIYCPTFIEGGMRVTCSSREFHDLSGIKGLKIRVPESKIYLDAFSALGANPTSMAFNEAITGLQQGVVDAIEIPLAGVYSLGVYRIVNNIIETNHIYTCAEVCFSRDFWDKLTEEEQGWFNEAAKLAGEEEKDFVRGMHDKYIADFEEAGCNYISAEDVDRAAMKEAVQPVFDEYRQIIGEDIYDNAMQILDE